MKKTGRNEPCHCGSGQKYKYCHLDADRDRIVSVDRQRLSPSTPAEVNFKDDLSNLMTGFTGPLMRFCKDQDFYLFKSALTIGDLQVASERLGAGTLTKMDLIAACKDNTRRDTVEALIKDACAEYESFAGREHILLDAVDAHFTGKYTLSVPTLFAQLEGVLRSVGSLQRGAKFKPTIKRDIWNNRLLFGVGDSAQEFNAFISRLYEGQSEDAFNRNPVLHGIDVSYDTEEYSLVLLLCLLEIRTFLWFERNTAPIV